MPYLIFSANGEEFSRRELSGSVVIGRALDCDISIHDILLSRHHCRIERLADTWELIDLGSRNGTHRANHPITRHVLREGDHLRMGRTKMTFHSGPFIPAPEGTRRGAVVRPADPNEAMAGTVSGFKLIEPDEVERPANMPFPKPHPKEPRSLRDGEVYRMLDEIASSSWDSIMAETSRPLVMQRAAPRPIITAPRRIRSKPRVSMCLQAMHHAPASPVRAPRKIAPKLRVVGLLTLSMMMMLMIGGQAAPTKGITNDSIPQLSARPASAGPKTQIPTNLQLFLRALAPFLLSH